MAIITSIEGGKGKVSHVTVYEIFYNNNEVEYLEATSIGSPDDGVLDAILFFNEENLVKIVPTSGIHHINISYRVVKQ